MKPVSRREFLEAVAGLGAALFIGGCSKNGQAGPKGSVPRMPKVSVDGLFVASGRGPAKNTRAAIEAMGGMGKFVKKGDFVVIKPNIAWNRPPDAAATTNPEVVSELVRLCKSAGASKVLVLDHVIDRPAEVVLGFTGIKDAVEKAGGEVKAAQQESDYRTIEIPKGKLLKSDTLVRDILEADVFINVPIAKTHSATRLTLGLKNLMGCNWDRQSWHQSASLEQCIADYATAVRADLTVLDATRILLTNGPKGPGRTKDVDKVIVGTDPVAVDAYGAALFGLQPKEVSHILIAAQMGLGSLNPSVVKTV
ncbi:MAG: DUF362 domain-containing protein [Armatimonadota bacterium]|nr:DUF362 domain-containing protein [Armatimonadota bacterium]